MSAPYTLTDFLADQLKAAAPGAEWNASGVDRARELATVLIRNNISDLSKLRAVAAEWTRRVSFPGPLETVEGIAFDYEGRKIGYLGDADGRKINTAPILEGTLASWSAAGHGNVGYHVTLTPRGFALVPSWGSSSDAASIRGDLLTIGAIGVSMALPAAGINIGAAIGSAAVPASFAASYPTLTAAIGNAAIGAAFNGGNIEAAAKMAAMGAAGSIAGGYAGAAALSATDLQIVGKLADTATRALIAGRDVEQAIGLTLLQNPGMLFDAVSGPPAMAPLPIPEISINEGAAMDYIGDDAFFQPVDFGPVNDWQMAPLEIPDVIYESAPVTFEPISLSPEFAPIAMDDFAPLAFPELPALPEFIALQDVVIEPPIRAPQSDPFTSADARNLINTVSTAALAAISIAKAAKGINPSAQVNTTARYIDPRTGAATVALDTGVIQTRDASGRVVTSRPPTGQPQSTASGNVVMNNGDGTYTLISPSGQTRVIQYDQGAAGGAFDLSDIPIPAILGGVGLLLVLLRNR